ncbi:MAG: hypothetical protein NVV74_08875 [Magnetospirillum sp.]|nr:hypothetical protein [Magnetospirillum sp.]
MASFSVVTVELQPIMHTKGKKMPGLWSDLGVAVLERQPKIHIGKENILSRGAEWRRWEPHIHAPGTVMNNQFSGPNAWGDYLTALEQSTPIIEAIAVTDYYVTDTYQEILQHKAEGRLPAVKLIFPNVELRLDVATAKGGFVNLHLFVSPEDPQHIDELRRLLSRLQFNVMQDRFDCTRADLIRLGNKADPSIKDEIAALSYGANQFKVNFQKLREVFAESGWAKKNILIAVAGGATDGTSGVREAADQTIRREIEGFADIIFASSSAQREFWLGQKSLSPLRDLRPLRRAEALLARKRCS